MGTEMREDDRIVAARRRLAMARVEAAQQALDEAQDALRGMSGVSDCWERGIALRQACHDLWRRLEQTSERKMRLLGPPTAGDMELVEGAGLAGLSPRDRLLRELVDEWKAAALDCFNSSRSPEASAIHLAAAMRFWLSRLSGEELQYPDQLHCERNGPVAPVLQPTPQTEVSNG